MLFASLLFSIALFLHSSASHPTSLIPLAQQTETTTITTPYPLPKRQQHPSQPRLPRPQCFPPSSRLGPLILPRCIDQIHKMLVSERPRHWGPADFPWTYPHPGGSGCDITIGDAGSALEGASDTFSLNDVARAAFRVLEVCARDYNYGRGGMTRIFRKVGRGSGGGGGSGSGSGGSSGRGLGMTGVVPVYVQYREGGYLQRVTGNQSLAVGSEETPSGPIGNITIGPGMAA